jgi:hypothetical protein
MIKKVLKTRHYSSSIVSSGDSMLAAHWFDESRVAHRVRYELCVLAMRGAVHARCVLLHDVRVADAVCEFDADDVVWLLHRVLESASPLVSASVDELAPDTVSELVRAFVAQAHTQIAQRRRFLPPASAASALAAEFALIDSVTISNSDVIPDAPQPRRLNRVLRVFAERRERFARVTFVKCNEGRKRLILNRGFDVGGWHYEFLAYTKNQAFASTAWFVASDVPPDEDGATASSSSFNADSIRAWMGDFSNIDAPHKYGSRIGMPFSDSFQACHVPPDAIEEVADIIIERQNISYCFTDGCGQISPWLARRVWRRVRARVALLQPPAPPAEPVPSAFQIRLHGCKGVLVVNPQLCNDADDANGDDDDNDDDDESKPYPRGPHVRIRKSMIKYFAPHQNQLEVLQWSSPERGLLTRQIVAVLSFLGIRDETLLAKLNDYCADLRLAWRLAGGGSALAAVAAAEFGSLDQLRRMLRSGISASEPHVAHVLAALERSARLDLLRSTAFVVERARHALGVVDELGVLNHGEVFFQFTTNAAAAAAGDDGSRLALAQRVFVTKTPCMHPGDVRVLQAVDVPALHHIVDCVVFPQRGPRPHPSEIGGSDLDGDMYLICWDRDLIPPAHAHPATWHGSFSFDNAVHNSLPRRLANDTENSLFDETNFRLSRRKHSRSSTATGIAVAPLPPPLTTTPDEQRVLREQQLLELQLEFGDDLTPQQRQLTHDDDDISSTGGASSSTPMTLSPPLSPQLSDRSATTSTSSWSELSALSLTKMLHIAKENFITNERYHPDDIAQAHLAFADEKGLDCPECTQLAEQFACAVDSVKTGRVVHEYKRPREWPHFMTRLRPTRRSNSILGRLHDTIWHFLQKQQHQLEQQPPPPLRADADLCLPGVTAEHIAEALVERNAYQAECEALGLMYNHLSRDVAARASAFIGTQLRRLWRRRFEQRVAALPFDERLLHASAWYIVAHVDQYRTVRPDAQQLTPVHVRDAQPSFSWLLDDYLGYIKATAIVRASIATSSRLPALNLD